MSHALSWSNSRALPELEPEGKRLWKSSVGAGVVQTVRGARQGASNGGGRFQGVQAWWGGRCWGAQAVMGQILGGKQLGAEGKV